MMAEIDNDNKYIKCSRCNIKYHNDDAHIKNDFGYNRLNEQFKTCLKCRNSRKLHRTKPHIIEYNKDYNKTYYDNQPLVECEHCCRTLNKLHMIAHHKTNDCKQISFWKNKVNINDKNIGFFIYSDHTYYPYYKDITKLLNIDGLEPPKDLDIIHIRRQY